LVCRLKIAFSHSPIVEDLLSFQMRNIDSRMQNLEQENKPIGAKLSNIDRYETTIFDLLGISQQILKYRQTYFRMKIFQQKSCQTFSFDTCQASNNYLLTI
jgi:hypothetical protein